MKTLGLSDTEIHRRKSGEVFTNAYLALGEGFFRKLANVEAVGKQIATQGTSSLAYLFIIWEDIAYDYYPECRRQVVSFCREQIMGNVYVKIGSRGNRRVHIITAFN